MEDPTKASMVFQVSGVAGRQEFQNRGDVDFEQPQALWSKVFKEDNRAYLVNSMARSMRPCREDIK